MGGLALYKHIIWDFDGTLFDTYPVMGNAFQMTLLESGIIESLDEILKYMKISMTHAIQHYKEKYLIDAKFIEKYEEKRKSMECEYCKPYIGAEDICRSIYNSGKKNYLYTHRGESAIKLLKANKLYAYFTECITTLNGFERKPSPNAINYLIQKYNILNDEAIMIGDRELDILSAKNAGINACYFNEHGEKNKVAEYSINNLKQLKVFL